MESEPKTIESEATDWVIRLDSGPLSPDEQRQLDQWLAVDARHHGAFIRARSAWLDTDRLVAMVPRSGLSRAEEHGPGRRRSSFNFQVRHSYIAAAAALILTLATLFLLSTFNSGTAYTSEIGEVRNIALPDGTQLTLNTNTRATVDYKDHLRNIELDRGEALFKVAHDAARPFIVHANDVQIKAVGTAFTVRIDDTRTDVLVTEGTVEVTRKGTPPQRISANHQATLASSASRTEIESVATETITRELAWLESKAAFAGEPLSAAVAEINRYSRRPIYIDDPELAARPVVGIFNANDSEGFANAAAATFRAHVERRDDGIHLVQ
jgi:transmembrane sensor